MKRIYEKPMLAIENFMVSQHIAACSPSYANNIEIVQEDLKYAGYFADKGVCENALVPGITIIYNGTRVCYHTSVDNATIFSS